MTGLAAAQQPSAAQPKAAAPAAAAAKTYTLTVHVEGVNNDGGNIGVLVFQNERGWPEERLIALKDEVVPAHPGTVTVVIPGLPAGDYGVSIAHDVNKNRKLDKNFLGVPTEGYGISQNHTHALRRPTWDESKFVVAPQSIVTTRISLRY